MTNLKDKITNIAAVMAAVGTLLGLSVEVGLAEAKYKPYSLMLVGSAAIITGYATGKTADLGSIGSRKN